MDNGLTEAQAADVLQRDGPNLLTPPKQVPEIVKFLLQMFGGFAALLWLGAVLCFLSYGVERATKGSRASDDNVRLACLISYLAIELHNPSYSGSPLPLFLSSFLLPFPYPLHLPLPTPGVPRWGAGRCGDSDWLLHVLPGGQEC